MITQAATDLEKCLKLFKTEVTVEDHPDAKVLDMSEEDLLAGRVGEVRFDNVSFMYEGGDRGSAGGLKEISFVVKPGKMVALVGASGKDYGCIPSNASFICWRLTMLLTDMWCGLRFCDTLGTSIECVLQVLGRGEFMPCTAERNENSSNVAGYRGLTHIARSLMFFHCEMKLTARLSDYCYDSTTLTTGLFTLMGKTSRALHSVPCESKLV